MENNYIQAPQTSQHITYIKGKAPRVKHARRREVPKEYRKSQVAKIKAALQANLWQFR